MKLKEAGQSTIEFIVTFMFGLAIVFLFVNVTMNLALGYMAHYATYMASRVYLTYDNNSTVAASHGEAAQEAIAQFARYKLDTLGIPTSTLQVRPYTAAINAADFLGVGVWVKFERPISLFRAIAGDTKASLLSESYLGKEPTREQCLKRTCYGISGEESCTGKDVLLDDNGC